MRISVAGHDLWVGAPLWLSREPGGPRNHTAISTGFSISALKAVINSAPSAPSTAR